MPQLKVALEHDLNTYLRERGSSEHISAASLTVSLPNGTMLDVASGTTAFGGTTRVTPSNLFQIGSNTKAFTSMIMQHLTAAKALSVHQTVGTWLPQYPTWSKATIQQLLDMTSGIGSYDNTSAWEKAYAANPARTETAAQLIAYVDQNAPKLQGWNYSNTGYALSQLIIEKVTAKPYATVIRSMIAGTGIGDLYYYPSVYPATLRARTVAGYFYNSAADDAGLAPLLLRDVRPYSLSWTQAAGGVVATPHAVALWARDLYQGPLLTGGQRAQMQQLVSQKTGLPIAAASPAHPAAFGLGVAQVYKAGLGTFWFYEGETLGYRMVHAYFPSKNVVIAFGLNSQPPKAQDKVGDLARAIATTLSKHGYF